MLESYRYFVCNHRVSIIAKVNPSLRFCQVLVLTAEAHKTLLMAKPGKWENLGDIEDDSLREKICSNSI
jgi:hypothetical protein